MEKSSRSDFPIVGIGASAGGLAAFSELLAALPSDTGMAFVLVQHLDPTHASVLGEVLARTTKMKVLTATDGAKVERDQVYVIPPNVDLALEGDSLLLAPRQNSPKPHLAIDHFFRSLAVQRGARALGVVLSGTGSDGTEGLRAIRAEGGITFAQNPLTAHSGQMPGSAISAGVVDTGTSIRGIANRLRWLGRHPDAALAPEAFSAADEQRFEKILALVKNKTGVDFSEYKRGTVERRIARRMALREQESLESYLEVLQADELEAAALGEDVLIHVTSFFRDPAVFTALGKEIIPQLLEAKAKTAPFRAWVAGCSTGEEVYSLAIAILECVQASGQPRSIQIFGSDLSELAVEKARAGIYTDASLQEVSEELRRKYFVKLDHGYRIQKQVRELCIFVRHDLARDPPFAHLDLVCSRNVLIYFGAELQKRLMAAFHYCLSQPGFLVLGRSESIEAYGRFFTAVDRENRIYARTAARSELHFTPTQKAWPSLTLPPASTPMGPRTELDLRKQMDRLLLTAYAPPGVIVNDKLEVVHFSGRTSAYLQAPPGQPQTNVLKMAREGLLAPLTAALARSMKDGAKAFERDLEVGEPGATVRCDLTVIPLPAAAGTKQVLRAVLFEELAGPRGKRAAAKARKGSTLTRLQRELQSSRDYQQALLDDQARTNEDLGTANEELLSGNEELQSMNEELQTAKEELQSANEELTTVNDELHSGNRDLNLANTDLVNLLNTVEIPIVFVDARRRIRRFTPQAHSVFNVLATDIGRPIDDIKPKFEVADLDEQIAWSIANVTVRESQVRDQFGRWYRMQIRPYQTSEGKVSGAILSLVDIDVLKRHAEQAEWSRDYAVSVVDAVGVPLVVLDDKAHVISANGAFYESFGGAQEQARGRSFFALGNGEWDIPLLRDRLANLFARRAKFQTLEVEAAFPRVGRRIMSFSARAVRFRDAKPMVLLAIDDVSLRKQLLAQAQEARASAEQANLTKDAFLATLSHELRTPLGTMLMNAQLLRLPDLDAAMVQRAAAAIERSARSQSRMIEDLLDVSRIVTGKLSLALRPLSLRELIASVLENVALQAEAKSIRLEARLDGEPFSISGDSLRLQQVFSNLLTNAIKFTPAGGEVKIALTVEEDDAVLRVSDTGAGIDPAFLPFVFERFSQQENSNAQRSTGLGLGLSIVRDLVAMHGGKAQAASDGIGKGASFTISLPLLRGAPVEAAPESGSAAPDANLARLNGLRILMVDDDPETLETVGGMLRLNGAKVIVAQSAAEALRAAQESGLEVIISDIAMPGTDGYSLIRSIRALPAADLNAVPAIALTAVASSNGRIHSLEAGFQEHLEKPIDIGRLALAIAGVSAPRHA